MNVIGEIYVCSEDSTHVSLGDGACKATPRCNGVMMAYDLRRVQSGNLLNKDEIMKKFDDLITSIKVWVTKP